MKRQGGPRAVDDGDWDRVGNVTPAFPKMELTQIVGTHYPNELNQWIASYYVDNRVRCVPGGKGCLAGRDLHSGVGCDGLAGGKSIRQRGQIRVVFQWIARSNKPPDMIELQLPQRLFTDMYMPFMRRVERTAEQADSLSARGKGHTQIMSVYTVHVA